MKNTKKKFQDEELSHELFLRTRQKSKMGNAFTKNMSTDIKLRKALLSKIIQASEWCFWCFVQQTCWSIY